VSAKRELETMVPSDSRDKAAEYLEEGASALRMQQKHIKVADCSKHGLSLSE